MVHSVRHDMVTLRKLSGEEILVARYPNDLVVDLKRRVEDHFDIPERQQVLSSGITYLEDHLPLTHFGFPRHGNIDLDIGITSEPVCIDHFIEWPLTEADVAHVPAALKRQITQEEWQEFCEEYVLPKTAWGTRWFCSGCVTFVCSIATPCVLLSRPFPDLPRWLFVCVLLLSSCSICGCICMSFAWDWKGRLLHANADRSLLHVEFLRPRPVINEKSLVLTLPVE